MLPVSSILEKSTQLLHITSYCFGGSTCVRIGGTGLVNSVVIAHPGRFSLDQVKAIKVPASWACAEGSTLFLVPRIFPLLTDFLFSKRTCTSLIPLELSLKQS